MPNIVNSDRFAHRTEIFHCSLHTTRTAVFTMTDFLRENLTVNCPSPQTLRKEVRGYKGWFTSKGGNRNTDEFSASSISHFIDSQQTSRGFL
ncbi:hypothetical protein J6590_065452 [Homalodisca vitripennis]|nr:hypothetical protein J6590_065452 [Homalodisca vitripennis]